VNKKPIPQTDLELAPLCLGTDYFGTSVDEKTAFSLLDRYLEAGGNVIDTAEIYASWVPGGEHRSERLLGRYFAERKNRDRWVLSTKGAHPKIDTMHIPRMTRPEVQSDLESSLRRLGVEQIDIYWLHRDDPGTPVEEIVAMLEDFKRAGKIRYAGFSNWTLDRAEAARLAAKKLGLQGLTASQNQWSLARADGSKGDPTWAYIDEPFIDWHQKHQFAAFAYTAQAGGYFRRLETGTLDQAPQRVRDLFDHSENREKFQRLSRLASETGYSTGHLAIAYILNHPFPSFALVGPKQLSDLETILPAAEVKLTPEQLSFLALG
jgi:aryl-alcohol dehydrogenase-like predicted oxidoreductase